LALILAVQALATWRLLAGPLFPAPAEYAGTLNSAQQAALKERGCTLVGLTAQGVPVEYYCRAPQPGTYPARQLIESLPRVGGVLTKPVKTFGQTTSSVGNRPAALVAAERRQGVGVAPSR